MMICSACKSGHGQLFWFFFESYHAIITVTSLLTDFQCEACFAHIWGEKYSINTIILFFLISYTEKKTLSISEFRVG